MPRELAFVFFKLGATAFGGPAVHIALFEQEFVYRRKWLSHAEFLDLLGATNLIPGPNSTEMAIHIGHRRAGWPGLLVAGVCFIVPAFLITLACAWFYVRYRQVPALHGVLEAVKPVVLAIVLHALWRLMQSAVKNTILAIVTVVALAASFLGLNELIVLLLVGVGVLALRRWTAQSSSNGARLFNVVPPVLPIGLAHSLPIATGSVGLGPLFLFFLKVGSVLYGSGYVLLAFLRADLVERWGWLTEAELLDAVAVGQITPGPVFTTATFIGYVLKGPAGAGLATLGIFLPAFVFVAASSWMIPRLRRSPTAGAFLDGVNVASLALMAAVTAHLAGSAFATAMNVIIGIIAAILLLVTRINPMWLIILAAGVGWLQS